jgi:hypothetical protein
MKKFVKFTRQSPPSDLYFDVVNKLTQKTQNYRFGRKHDGEQGKTRKRQFLLERRRSFPEPVRAKRKPGGGDR